MARDAAANTLVQVAGLGIALLAIGIGIVLTAKGETSDLVGAAFIVAGCVVLLFSLVGLLRVYGQGRTAGVHFEIVERRFEAKTGLLLLHLEVAALRVVH